MLSIPTGELATADLHVDARYEGRRSGNAGDDPLPDLVGVSNQGGFRYLGKKECPKLIVLTTSLDDPEWPDDLNFEAGTFTYFGDNKKPGRELHDTPRFGNLLLRDLFNRAHTRDRGQVAPVLVFSRAPGAWRDVIFRGLAVPGGEGISQIDDLVAVWKLAGGHRFQNYRAKFTILDVATVEREWIQKCREGADALRGAPGPWLEWILSGQYRALRATRALETRTRDEQLPAEGSEREIIEAVLDHFRDNPHGFEACAAAVAQMMLRRVVSMDLTRRTRDGGRDAIGRYHIGEGSSSVVVEFALEAKCYSFSSSVGVREVARLVSRLRHRQFGVLVTTSWVHEQAYREIKEDGHPIVVISGGDIARVLKAHGFATPGEVRGWLAGLSDDREPFPPRKYAPGPNGRVVDD